jgi:hypothetical protein
MSVYFLHYPIPNYLKIGFSDNPERRAKDLQNNLVYDAYLLKVIRGSRKTEKKLHTKFSQYQLFTSSDNREEHAKKAFYFKKVNYSNPLWGSHYIVQAPYEWYKFEGDLLKYVMKLCK